MRTKFTWLAIQMSDPDGLTRDKRPADTIVPGSPRLMSGVRGCFPAAALLALILLGGDNAFPATPEYEVKAAHIFNFAKFFEWPNAETGITVCIYGKDPFDGFLDDVTRNQSIHGRPV